MGGGGPYESRGDGSRDPILCMNRLILIYLGTQEVFLKFLWGGLHTYNLVSWVWLSCDHYLSFLSASTISSQLLLTLYIVALADSGMIFGWIYGPIIGCLLTFAVGQILITLTFIRIKVIVKKFKDKCVLARIEDSKKITLCGNIFEKFGQFARGFLSSMSSQPFHLQTSKVRTKKLFTLSFRFDQLF